MARLMVLEGDANVRRFLCMLFESNGHQVAFDAGAGHVGLAALARAPEGFDAIVADLRLPIACGFDVLAGARALAGRAGSVPVVLASNFWTEEEVSLARDLGVFATIAKPFDLDSLLATVNEAAARRTNLARAA